MAGSIFVPQSLVAAPVNEDQYSLGAVQSSPSSSERFLFEEYEDPEVFMPQRGLLHTIFDFTWKLILVLIILYGTVYVLKLLYKNKLGLSDRGSMIAIKDTFFIKQNQAVYIMEITGRYFAVGATNYNISVICEITDDTVIATLKENKAANEENNFKQTFSSLLGKGSGTLDARVAESSRRILDQINKISNG